MEKLAIGAPCGTVIEAGTLTPIVTFARERPSYLPDTPTAVEAGYDVPVQQSRAVAAPKGTPPAAIKVLRDAVRQAVKETEVVTASAKLDTPISYLDADEFNAYWERDAQRLAQVVRMIGKVESAK